MLRFFSSSLLISTLLIATTAFAQDNQNQPAVVPNAPAAQAPAAQPPVAADATAPTEDALILRYQQANDGDKTPRTRIEAEIIKAYQRGAPAGYQLNNLEVPVGARKQCEARGGMVVAGPTTKDPVTGQFTFKNICTADNK